MQTNRSINRRSVGFLLGIFAATALFADLTITQSDELGTITQVYKGSKSATIQEDETIVLNYRNKTLLHIHQGLGIYCEASLDQYKKDMLNYAQSVQTRMMDASIRELTNEGYSKEEAEAFLKQMMNSIRQNPSGDVSLETRPGEKTSVSGYQIQQYLITAEGQPMAEMWISSDLKKRIEKETGAGASDQFDAAFRDIFLEIQNTGNDKVKTNPLDAEMDKLRKKGYVVFERELYEAMGDYSDSDQSIPEISISQEPIADGLFAPPDDFRKVDVVTYMTQLESWTNDNDTEMMSSPAENSAEESEYNEAAPTFPEPCGGLDMGAVHQPVELEALLGPSNVSGFQRQIVKTCMHNKGVNMFGVRIPPSGVQSAFYTKNQSEAIYFTLTIAVPDSDETENEPVAGSGIESIQIDGYSGTQYAYVQAYQGRQEKITLFLSPAARLEIEYSCIAGTRPTVVLSEWIPKALHLKDYTDPAWIMQ